MDSAVRNRKGFATGALIGSLGGLIGLGGAEFRLPVLIRCFQMATLEAVIFNKAMSLAVVTAALLIRGLVISPGIVWAHADIILNLLAGSLIGAWWAAGHAMRLPRDRLNRIIMILLMGLSLVMLTDAWQGPQTRGDPLFNVGPLRLIIGVIAGLGIGVVAAVLGVAGGELLIPAIVLIYALDIKLAGSLSLAVSLPTMLTGFTRYAEADAFRVLRREKSLLLWMATGSILGAALGGVLLGLVPTRLLMGLLGVLLFFSAVKTFRHAH